jgi:hypothetical protein
MTHIIPYYVQFYNMTITLFIPTIYGHYKKKKEAFMDGFFLDGFTNRPENKICRWFFRNCL